MTDETAVVPEAFRDLLIKAVETTSDEQHVGLDHPALSISNPPSLRRISSQVSSLCVE